MCVVMSVIHGFDVPRSRPVSSQGVMPLFGVNPFYVPLVFNRSFGSHLFHARGGMKKKKKKKKGLTSWEIGGSEYPGIF